MNLTVKVLPDAVASRIAAGEVVERPASVVKELVENAVDAGSRRVRIVVEGAGKASLRVEDDGLGMGRDDALTALERHATSKITSADDLATIDTLGFRGEALPSIASVSLFTLVTRPERAAEATEIRVEGGDLLSCHGVGGARGTTVTVADLFYNVPARKKFLKSDATELRRIVETVTELALAHFDVGFDLRSGGRTLVAVPPDQSLEERAAELLGGGQSLYWYRRGDGRGSFTLGHGAPHENRTRRTGIRFFVNGRAVQDRILFRAVMDGHRGVLESGRYPLALLWLDVPPETVDVNVHPSKREVRFSDEGGLFRWVAGLTAEALARTPWLTEGGAPVPPGPRPELERVAEAVAGYAARTPRASPRYDRGHRERDTSTGPGPAGCAPQSLFPAVGPAPEAAPPRFGGLRFLGAFDATYLVFEDPARRELVLLDQHAAHERVCYERLLVTTAGGRPPAQRLLVPATLECSPAEMAAFDERKGSLAALGFGLEPFGAASLALSEVPAGLSGAAAEAAVRDVLAAEPEALEAPDPEGLRQAAAKRAACAAAVKAHHVLTPEEVEGLLASLEPLRNPGNCPHGRPLILRFPRSEIEGMFKRR